MRTALPEITRRRALLGGTALAGLSTLVACESIADGRSPSLDEAPAGEFHYGIDEGYDAGTSGDYVVSQTGSDSAIGTLSNPFRTLQRAIDQIAKDTSGGIIRVRDGIYREAVSTDKLRSSGKVKISGYGTEKPTITAGEVLSGLASCTSRDRDDVGENWRSIFKVELPSSAFDFDHPAALNLHEDGMPLRLATDTQDPSDLLWRGDVDLYHQAERFQALAAGKIKSILDRRILSKYSARQLAGFDGERRAGCYIYTRPNFHKFVQITSSDGRGRVEVNGNFIWQSPKAKHHRYQLVNILPAMQPGQWGVIDRGKGSPATIYVWPRKIENIAGRIEYSARTKCWDLGRANNLTVEGFRFRMPAGDGAKEGISIGSIAFSLKSKKSITLRHLECAGAFHLSKRTFGGVYLSNTNNFLIEHVTVRDCVNSFGLFVTGAGGGVSKNGVLQFCDVHRVTNSPIRVFGTQRSIFRWNWLHDCARDSHSNKVNFYLDCDACLLWGNRFEDCYGYATFQSSSRIHIAMNVIPASGRFGDARAIVDQQNRRPPPVQNSRNYIFNNTCPPKLDARRRKVNNGVMLSKKYGDMRFGLFNNVFHGGGIVEDRSKSLGQSNNVLTGLLGFGTQGASRNLPRTTIYQPALAKIYRDVAKPDYRSPENSILRELKGRDMRDIIESELRPLFPDHDFSIDAYGRRFSWDRPFIGADSRVSR